MRITEGKELLELKENTFYGEIPELINSNIYFHGKNNILACEKGVTLKNSRIDFHFSNSIIYLSKNKNYYFVNIAVSKDSVCFIGQNNYFNGTTNIIASEAKNIVIGSDCLFSYDVVIRTSDAHGIYSTKTNKRLNYAKSIFIGDHVWFGQNTIVFKGTRIHSGSIIGAGSVLSNKIVPSNVTFAGNPASLVSEDTFWIPNSTHRWSDEEFIKMEEYSNPIFIYEQDLLSFNFDEIDEYFSKSEIEEVLGYIKANFTHYIKNDSFKNFVDLKFFDEN